MGDAGSAAARANQCDVAMVASSALLHRAQVRVDHAVKGMHRAEGPEATVEGLKAPKIKGRERLDAGPAREAAHRSAGARAAPNLRPPCGPASRH
ncbi:hypothetical protein GCM10028802_32420 [Terrabacter terrigena]